MTQVDLISASLTEIGALSPGEPLRAAELQQGSVILGQMLDAWQADRLYVWAMQRILLVPATLKQTYTLGVGGDFNIPRPAKITRYGVVNLGNPQQPLELALDSLTEAQWSTIPVKNIASALPKRIWDDQQFPLRNLNFWPVPNVQVNFTVYQWSAISTWPDYVTDVTFPPGYLEAIRYSLALRLAPSFGAAAQVTPLLVQLATSALNRIKTMNAPLIDLKCEPMLISGGNQVYDWRTDTWLGT
jgi:hypothetical protein